MAAPAPVLGPEDDSALAARQLVGKRGPLAGGAVHVSGAAAARVEGARRGRGGGGGGCGCEGRGHARGGRGERRAHEVAGAAAAGVDVAVLRDGGVRFGDYEAGEAGHCWWWGFVVLVGVWVCECGVPGGVCASCAAFDGWLAL